jgi:hypothetical protein
VQETFHPPIYLLYFTETAVYSAHYQSIMPAVSVTATSSTSTNVTNVTNQRNRLESIPENGEIPDPVTEIDESFLTWTAQILFFQFS